MISQKNIVSTAIRFKFYKKGEFKFLSHLDISRIIFRALNRAGLGVAYSGGYNPKPKISFSTPTPLGIESLAEYADVILDNDIGDDEFKRRINRELKQQMQVTEAGKISIKTDSLMNEIAISLYSFELDIRSSGRPLPEKFYKVINNWLKAESDFSRSIFDLEIIPAKKTSHIILLKLYGYAKIFKEKDNQFFKLNDFYPFLKNWLKEYGINIGNVKKEELFIISGDGLKTPMEIIQAARKGE